MKDLRHDLDIVIDCIKGCEARLDGEKALAKRVRNPALKDFFRKLVKTHEQLLEEEREEERKLRTLIANTAKRH